MIRYFALATAIVLTVVVLATAWSYRNEIAARVHPTAAPTAMNGGVGGDTNGPRDPFEGEGAWALSAVPDCLQQQSESRGTIAYVRARLPKGAVEVSGSELLHYGPCTIFVSGDEVVVARGRDRLVVPPHATLYRVDGTLALLRTSGSAADLRVYTSP